jgi:cytoskeleton protein RodZ
VTDTVDSERAASASPAPDTAGARLRAAREAAGLSIESVAQQLKLAPRQVRALEDDDFQRLPGRTFVRGFARNYARFLQLDPDTVVGMLPASDSGPALQRPSLAGTRRPMGEMPVEGASRQSPTRWLLPMLMVVAVAGAVYYEYLREHGRDPFGWVARPLAPSGPESPAAAAAGGTSTTALPNPMTPPGGGGSAEQREGSVAAAAPGATASSPSTATASSPSTATASSPSAATASSPSTATPSSPSTAATPPTSAPAPSGATATPPRTDTANSEAALVLAFKGTARE